MTPQPVWDEEVRIKAVEGDFYGKWKLSSLFLALQEAAARHAVALGAGYYELLPKNLVWMLARFKIRFEAMPAAGEQVRIQTWPKGKPQKITFTRDFLLLDADGQRVYARAGSAWLLADIRTRRMQRPEALGLAIPLNEGLSALDEPLERIKLDGELHEEFSVQARSSMLDLLGHVTSARYLEWVADCFPVQAYQNDALAWLQINFNHEIRPGQRVSVRCGLSAGQPATWLVQGTNLEDGANAFEAALGFRGPAAA